MDCKGKKINSYHIFFVRKTRSKGPLGRPRHKWEYIKMNVGKTGWLSVEWINVAQDKNRLLVPWLRK